MDGGVAVGAGEFGQGLNFFHLLVLVLAFVLTSEILLFLFAPKLIRYPETLLLTKRLVRLVKSWSDIDHISLVIVKDGRLEQRCFLSGSVAHNPILLSELLSMVDLGVVLPHSWYLLLVFQQFVDVSISWLL